MDGAPFAFAGIAPEAAAATRWDAVIVGAGPGGSAAAIEFARRGRRVLLVDRAQFPRDKSCGDGITLSGVEWLDRLGVLPALADAQGVEGVRVHMRGRGARDFRYARDGRQGIVVPRLVLDAVLLQGAMEAGAAFLPGCRAEGLIRDGAGTVTGVEIRCGGGLMHRLEGYAVIAADGAASKLAREAGLREAPEQGYGTALRGYVEGVAPGAPMLEIALPLSDVTDRYLLPSYGWMFPTGKGTANVGVGLFCRAHDANVRRLFEEFLDRLRRDFPPYRDMRLTENVLGAPLRFDFAPERAARPGLLLVGDAAGLISPFTGEGISFAMESGALAAECVDRCLRTGAWPGIAAEDYAMLLGERFAGYFGLGNRAGRRYALIWRVLDDTFDSDAPVHNLLRRAVLVPEGTGEDLESAILDDVAPLVRLPDRPLAGDLRAVGARLNQIVREDWPFLSRLSFAGRRTDMVAFRPSLFLLLTAYLGPSDAGVRRAAATALELAYLGLLSQSGVRGVASGDGKANWGDKLAILTADYLLAAAQEVGAGECAALVPRIMEAMAGASAARVDELQAAWRPDLPEAERVAQMRQATAAFFRLPCELGAVLAGRDDLAPALGRYGEALGLAYLMAEEDLALEREPGSTPFASDLSRGLFPVPVLRAVARDGGAARAAGAFCADRDTGRFLEAVRGPAKAAGCRDLGAGFRDAALAELAGLPRDPVTRALAALARFALDRDAGTRPDLAAFLADQSP